MKLFAISMGLGLIGSLAIVATAYVAANVGQSHEIAEFTICESRVC